jgi:hypothetical protein
VGNSRVTAQLAVSQEGLSSMKLVERKYHENEMHYIMKRVSCFSPNKIGVFKLSTGDQWLLTYMVR